MTKKFYENPSCKVEKFETSDVLLTSIDVPGDTTGIDLPEDQFN